MAFSHHGSMRRVLMPFMPMGLRPDPLCGKVLEAGLASGAASLRTGNQAGHCKAPATQRSKSRFHGEILSSQVTGTDVVSEYLQCRAPVYRVHFMRTLCKVRGVLGFAGGDNTAAGNAVGPWGVLAAIQRRWMCDFKNVMVYRVDAGWPSATDVLRKPWMGCVLCPVRPHLGQGGGMGGAAWPCMAHWWRWMASGSCA